MNNQFKAGDLALVIGGGFMGQVAELVDWVKPGDIVTGPTGKQYVYTPAAGCCGWLCRFGDEMAVKYEKYLMPLRGDFSTAPERAQEVPA